MGLSNEDAPTEIDVLRDEIESLRDELGKLREYIETLHSELEIVGGRFLRFRVALEYYAHGPQWSRMGSGAYADLGKVARAALEGE